MVLICKANRFVHYLSFFFFFFPHISKKEVEEEGAALRKRLGDKQAFVSGSCKITVNCKYSQ